MWRNIIQRKEGIYINVIKIEKKNWLIKETWNFLMSFYSVTIFHLLACFFIYDMHYVQLGGIKKKWDCNARWSTLRMTSWSLVNVSRMLVRDGKRNVKKYEGKWFVGACIFLLFITFFLNINWIIIKMYLFY